MCRLQSSCQFGVVGPAFCRPNAPRCKSEERPVSVRRVAEQISHRGTIGVGRIDARAQRTSGHVGVGAEGEAQESFGVMLPALKGDAASVEETACRCIEADALFIASEQSEERATDRALREIRSCVVIGRSNRARGTKNASRSLVFAAFVVDDQAPNVRVSTQNCRASGCYHHIDRSSLRELRDQWRRQNHVTDEGCLDQQ